MANKEVKVIVVGGGLAGLMATLKILEGGGKVDLFSYCPVKRSHSLCAQGGINACMDLKGEHDSIYEHFDDTVYGGDFLADQLAVKGMVETAPKIIKMFDRMGVPFTRNPEGALDMRNFGGQKNKRTLFAGSTTGQQLLYALDEQVRRWEVKGGVKKYEFWEFIKVIKNKDGVVRGIVAQNMNSNEIVSFPADVVILATGGPGQVFGRCTASTICNGSAVTSVYKDGAHLANPEFIQIHPTAIPGSDKNRLMSEACRGECGVRIRRPTRRSAGTSWRICIRLTAIWCPVMWPPAPFTRFACIWAWACTSRTACIWIFPISPRTTWSASWAASWRCTRTSWARARLRCLWKSSPPSIIPWVVSG